MFDRQHLFTSGLVALLLTSGLVGADAGWAQAPSVYVAQADDDRPPSSKLHPALLRRLDEEAGPAKAWVFFTDKGIRSPAEYDAAIDAVAATYNQRAIQRRLLRGRAAQGGPLFDGHDLPVVQSYVDAVTATGARRHVTTRWLNAVSVYATRDQVERLAMLPFVDRLEPVARSRRVEPVDVGQPGEHLLPSGGTTQGRVDYGLSAPQLQQINLIAVHNEGYIGEGVIIGILDTGFERSHVAFNDPNYGVTVVAEYDFVDNDGNTQYETGDPSSQHNHGTMILGCIGAYAPGDLVGGAYAASFVLAKTEDTTGEYPAEEDNYVAGLEFIEQNGGDMTTSSLGYIDWYEQEDLDGQTAVTTIAVNISTGQGVHHCNAAGNEYHDSDPGTSHLIAPADAFQCITCGAVSSSGTIASFSSDGPSADGRVKPELLALGVSTDTVSPYSTTGYTTASGTSLSTPLVACAVACLTQAHPEWTVDQMRQVLFCTADYYTANGTYDPLYVYGYGVVNAYATLEDCNSNGVPDVIDIMGGTSQDCQPNGVPDECEVAAGSSEDCNGNGVPDECDIALPPLTLVDDADPLLGWVEVAASGLWLNLSDDGETQVTMQFTNDVFTSSTVQVGNNGAIGFDTSADLDSTNGMIPSSGLFGGAMALAPLWDNIDSDTGNVYWRTIGTEPDRTSIVEWHKRPHYPGDSVIDGDEVTFQVQIFETPAGGVFAQFLYLNTDFDDPAYDNGASATIGFQTDGSSGCQWSYNQPVVDPGVVLSLAQLPPTSADENGNGIPDECEWTLGDLNCDSSINGLDIDPFVLVLTSTPPGYPEYYAQYPDCNHTLADCNGDGSLNGLDIDSFVAQLTGG